MADPMSAPLPFPLEGHRFVIEASAHDGHNPIVQKSDGVTLGSLAIRTATGRGRHLLAPNQPADTQQYSDLVIDSLCIDRPLRGYGAGSEAARLLVRAAAQAGYKTLHASAPPGLGLAVYFWMRMGFHPLFGEGPEGGIWFEQSLK